MKHTGYGVQKGRFLSAGVGLTLALATGVTTLTPTDAHADGWVSHIGDVKIGNQGNKLKFSLDDTKWITIGAGFRGSGIWQERAGNSGYKESFSIDNARLYVNGQVHKYIKFEINTECFFCNNDSMRLYTILDAIGKFEYNRYFNIWGGRMLVPTERGELNGPYYHATHDGFKTPFFPADFSTKFGRGGAGRYGRDDGGTFWGSVEPGFMPGTLQYAVGVFRGLRSKRNTNSGVPFGPNQNGNVKVAGRVTYNWLNPENNPGYYTSGTYFGKAGDILATAFGIAYQKDAAGSRQHKSSFVGLVADLLFEKVMPNNMGVFTFNGEYKRFFAGYDSAAFNDPDCFCVFNGQSWSLTGLYLIPHKVWIGQFQPYGRFTSVQPRFGSNREEIEGGVNYVIDGFNARVSAYYQHGDLLTKGLNYSTTAAGPKVDVFKLSFQLQI